MRIDAIRITSLAQNPKLPDKYLSGRVSGTARLCNVFIAANQLGVDIFPPFAMKVTWNGGNDFFVETDHHAARDYIWSREVDQLINFPSSYWCSKLVGVFQLDVGWIWRTQMGVKLLLTGPINSPSNKSWIHSGLVDSDWFHIPFTVNIQAFNIGDTFHLDPRTPVARLVPIVDFRSAASIDLNISDINDEPELVATWRRYLNDVYGDDIGPELKRIHRGIYGKWKRIYEQD